jgi:UDP-N-acetylmuramoylalanine-D-glutamate ligase
MNMYSLDAPHSLTEARRRRFEVFAGQASGALQLASQQVRDSQILSDLEQALNSRAVIDQALGIIMGQPRCTSEEAFTLLRQRSQTRFQRVVGGEPLEVGVEVRLV